MTTRMNQIIAPGKVAVITGAAKGIGTGVARELGARGMRLALLDIDGDALEGVAGELGKDVLVFPADAANLDALFRFKNQIQARLGNVHLLVNNVGMTKHGGPWDAPEGWQDTMTTNFTAVLAGQHVFVPDMIASGQPGAIVNLGSKEGITTPPGNAAYSVAKAGVKVLTEQLAHDLLTVTQGRLSAHLFVPGYTWTPMNFPDTDFSRDIKPEAPWSVEQLVDYFMARLMNEDFYILCPDNEVTSEMDAKRIRWAMDDMIQNRPALSRWHPNWKSRFAEWMKK